MITFVKYFLLLALAWSMAFDAYSQSSPKQNVPFEATNSNPADSHYFHALMHKMHGQYKLAEQEFKRFVSRGQHSEVGNFHLAELSAYVEENYKSALRYSKRAYESDTNNKWYRMQYADNLAHNNQFKKGAQLYAGLTGMHDHQEEYYMRQMQFQWQLARYDIVLDLIDSMGKYTIQDQDYLDVLRIEVFDAMRDTANLEKVLLRRIEHSPYAKDRQLLLFKFYEITGQIEKADAMQQTFAEEKDISDENEVAYLLALFSRNDSLTLRPIMKEAFVDSLDLTTIHNLFGMLASGGNSNSVMTYFFLDELKKLVQNNDAHYLGSEFVSRLYHNINNIDSSLKFAEISIKSGNPDPSIYNYLVENYFDLAKYQDAIRVCSAWMRIDKESSRAHFLRGAALYHQEDFNASIQFLKMALAKASKEEQVEDLYRADIYFYIGLNYYAIKDSLNFRKSYDSSLKYNPDNAVVLNNYAYWLAENTDELDLALTLSARSLALSPDDPIYLDTYAWILYKQGNYQEARTYQRRVISLTSKDPSAVYYDHLGDIEIKLGNKKEAIANWRKALKVVGSNEVISEKIKSHE